MACLTARPPSPLVTRILELVIRELGNVGAASRLNATPVLVDMWLKGEAHMSEQTFLRLVDVLVEIDPAWEEWDKK